MGWTDWLRRGKPGAAPGASPGAVPTPAPPKRREPLLGFTPEERKELCSTLLSDTVRAERLARQQGRHISPKTSWDELVLRTSEADLAALARFHDLMDEEGAIETPFEKQRALVVSALEVIPSSARCLEQLMPYPRDAGETLALLQRLADADLRSAELWVDVVAKRFPGPPPPELLKIRQRIAGVQLAKEVEELLGPLGDEPVPLEHVVAARDRLAPPGSRGLWIGSREGLTRALGLLFGQMPVGKVSKGPRGSDPGVSFTVHVEMKDGATPGRLFFGRIAGYRFGLFGDGIVADWDDSQGPIPVGAVQPRAVRPQAEPRPAPAPAGRPAPSPGAAVAAKSPLAGPPASTRPQAQGGQRGLRIEVGMTLEEVTKLLGQPRTRATAAEIARLSGLGAGPERMGIPADQVYAIYEHATGTYRLVFRGGRVVEVNGKP